MTGRAHALAQIAVQLLTSRMQDTPAQAAKLAEQIVRAAEKRAALMAAADARKEHD